MSDHYPCMLSYVMSTGNQDQTKLILEKRKITEEAITKIQQDLLFTDWSLMYDLDVDKSYAFLLETIKNKLDLHALKKLIKIRSCDKFREPWMTVSIKKYNSKCQIMC